MFTVARKKDHLSWTTPLDMEGMTFRQGLKHLGRRFPTVLRQTIVMACVIGAVGLVLRIVAQALLGGGLEKEIDNAFNHPAEYMLLLLVVVILLAGFGAVISLPTMLMDVASFAHIEFDADHVDVGKREIHYADIQGFQIAVGEVYDVPRRFLLLWVREGTRPDLELVALTIAKNVQDDTVREACLRFGLRAVLLPFPGEPENETRVPVLDP